jgi:hypothetical protein
MFFTSLIKVRLSLFRVSANSVSPTSITRMCPIQNVSQIGQEPMEIVDGSNRSTAVAALNSLKLALAGQRFLRGSEKRFDNYQTNYNWYWATE